MSKKRKTRAQKIITELRKELERQKSQQFPTHQFPEKTQKKSIETKTGYSFISKNISLVRPKQTENKQNQSLESFDSKLIKGDLLKTFYLSLIFLLLIGLTYWYLEKGGEMVIRGFFHL